MAATVTREEIVNGIESLRKQRQEFLDSAIAAAGAIQVLQGQLASLNERDAESKPTKKK